MTDNLKFPIVKLMICQSNNYCGCLSQICSACHALGQKGKYKNERRQTGRNGYRVLKSFSNCIGLAIANPFIEEELIQMERGGQIRKVNS